MRSQKGIKKQKVSVLFPVDLLKKIRMLASLREESLSQTIIWLTEKGIKEELGDGKVNLKIMDKLVGSIPIGGDALKDSEEIYE